MCTGSVIVPGRNDLATRFPNLHAQWDDVANGSLDPEALAPFSHRKVGWVCAAEHRWVAAISDRTAKGNGCPQCYGREPVAGETDLASRFPELAEEYSHKNERPPSEVTQFSERRVLWECPRGHEYTLPVHKRTARGQDCTFCSFQKLLPGFNDLQTVYPAAASRWVASENGRPASHVLARNDSSADYLWECKEGHRYRARICHATKDQGCGVCAGQVLIPGVNDLASQRPEELSHWDYENNDVQPDQVGHQSGIPRWWKCEREHRWFASPNAKAGCAACLPSGHTSIPEIALREALAGALPEGYAVRATGATLPVRWGKRSTSQVDILVDLPDGSQAIVEYDGAYWHRHRMDDDLAKTTALLAAGHRVVRVRAGDLDLLPLEHTEFLQIRCEPEGSGVDWQTALAEPLWKIHGFLVGEVAATPLPEAA